MDTLINVSFRDIIVYFDYMVVKRFDLVIIKATKHGKYAWEFPFGEAE